MPYSEQHKRETRKRIIQSARRLFNRHGFTDVSIDDIMAGAGLTRGGFYKHFSGKDDLYGEAVLEFICAERPEAWQAAHVAPDARGAALSRMILDAYLSQDHFEDREGSCPLIAIPSDVGRGGEGVKGAFRQVLAMMVDIFAGNLGAGKGGPRERALALTAMMVGAMALARAVDDTVLAEELRSSARAQAIAMAGWE
jgi:AcrR family transcriptional regulator